MVVIAKRLPPTLFFLRITIFLVMFMWTLDKFIRPDHAAAVYKAFYHIGGLGNTVMYVIAVLEFILIILFVLGMFKRITYGLVFVFHAISTISSYPQYFEPFKDPNLLFFAAWPMLAASFALWYLRDYDKWTVM